MTYTDRITVTIKFTELSPEHYKTRDIVAYARERLGMKSMTEVEYEKLKDRDKITIITPEYKKETAKQSENTARKAKCNKK